MKKYIAFLLGFLAVSSAVVSCSDDSDDSSTQELYRKNKEAGETFLMQNRDSAGVIETYTGLQYKVDTLGTGIKPTVDDSVKMTYLGTLVNGTKFTYTHSTLLVDDQIKGMKEGLQLMPEGSVFDLYIPYYLAYNTSDQQLYYDGKIVSISPYSMLHFRVKLEKVVPFDESAVD